MLCVVVDVVVVVVVVDYTYYGNTFSNSLPVIPESLPIHLTNVICTGLEASLLDCSYQPGQSTCDHFDDVGVACIPSNPDSPIFSKKEVF